MTLIVKRICRLCRGKKFNVENTCDECNGTGYSFDEDNPQGQCDLCGGEKVIEHDVCPRCLGSGKEPEDDDDDDY